MTYVPYSYRVDVYKKNPAFDYDSGESTETFDFDRTVRCNYMPSRGEERLVGRLQNPHSYILWLDEPVDYEDQLRNLKDKYGTVIEDGPFNVIAVKAFSGYSKIHYYEVNAQAVLD